MGAFRSKRDSQRGFTIVELMIATLVFSVILLVITYGVLHFTSDYYKGVNSSTTQSTARSALDTISQAIQLNGGQVIGSAGGTFCAGDKVFVYTTGKRLSGAPTATSWGLYEMDNTSPGCAHPAAPVGGTELLSTNMRLSDFSVTPVSAGGTLWKVTLRVAFGSDDLFYSPAGSTPAYLAPDATCASLSGSQFCSVAVISTTVQQRIVN